MQHSLQKINGVRCRTPLHSVLCLETRFSAKKLYLDLYDPLRDLKYAANVWAAIV